jgi:S1-C subfamily serine protease
MPDETPNDAGDDAGDDAGAERGGGLPPHQLDRVWFHPSELGGVTATRSTPARGRRDWGLAAAAAVCGVVATLVVLGATGTLDGDGSAEPGTAALTPSFASLSGADHTAGLVSSIGVSVMTVRAATSAGTTTGSGFALGGDRVLTNASLVTGASSVSVTTSDGRVLGAKVVGSDDASDLTVLRVDDAHVPAARLGSADELTVGSWVLAVGAAGGERRWASQGVVSGIGELVAAADGRMLPGLLGTDVDPSATAGGGPLLDENGGVVAILSRSAPGYALPIDVARDIADQLSASGRARHGWLGVDAADAADRAGGGAVITGLSPGGPAEAAGLVVGDVVSELADDRVADAADLIAAVARRRPDDPVMVTVWRGTTRTRVSVKLGERTLVDSPSGP